MFGTYKNKNKLTYIPLMVCENGIVVPYKYIIVNKLMNTVIRFICLFAVYMLFCRVYVILHV